MSSSSTSDTCSSRHFSWLMKSCFSNPHHPHRPSPLSAADPPPTSISSLPDDLLLECLSRVPHSTLPSLPAVCRRWAHLLNCPSFHLLRIRHHHLSRVLFCISISKSTLFAAALRFAGDSESSWKVSSFVPSGDNADGSAFSLFSQYFRSVSIGRKIYIIGRMAMLRCDTWTGTLVPKAGMGLVRKKFAAAAVGGRILVAGGCARSSAVEEYDPDENTWRVITDAPKRRYGCIGASADGVFYVIGGLRIGTAKNEGSVCPSRAAGADGAHVYASSMDLYDVEARAWLRSRSVPGGGCVVAACAAGGYVYILSSHAVELSFWKFGASRRSCSFGEWSRIRSPPLPAQVRLDSTVRFSCVGAGDRVVLVQVVGCIDDLLRRSGRSERGLKEGLVLVYDCAGGEWSRVADMPEVVTRAACVCVEC
ncbi:galactose oxidase/kelch repeat superfamily protein [Striga asiatica]|uniref:Galactose oxidase/kelch repeat superfamily protein n=1 Tax=Striga asiatica TaxID=4170 RepID=A0A5A7RBN1_STRAF|nr:galactose oxidase/kelch repeat superfamily protein [Striga asiatica]